MMSSPFPTLGICLFYAYFSKVLGPKLMENRKPFDLRQVLVVYNFVQTVFSSWIFYEVSIAFIVLLVWYTLPLNYYFTLLPLFIHLVGRLTIVVQVYSNRNQFTMLTQCCVSFSANVFVIYVYFSNIL